MSRIELRVPKELYPKKDPVNPCPCQFKVVKLKTKRGTVTWLKQVGDAVKKDEVVCEGEVEKKTLEFTAPEDGILAEICIPDEGEFGYQDILGYLESKEA